MSSNWSKSVRNIVVYDKLVSSVFMKMKRQNKIVNKVIKLIARENWTEVKLEISGSKRLKTSLQGNSIRRSWKIICNFENDWKIFNFSGSENAVANTNIIKKCN